MTRTPRPDSGIDRRTFLGVATTALAATAGSAAASQSEIAEWLSDAPNYDGDIADQRASDEVRVTVGAGDGFVYDPPAIRVDPGTTVVWEWSGEGGSHDVTAEGGAFESDLLSEAGASFEHTFDEGGRFLYACTPHVSMGMKGAVVVDDSASEEGDATASTESGASRTTVVGTAVGFLVVLLSPFGLWLREASRQ